MSDDNSFRNQGDFAETGVIPSNHDFQGAAVRTIQQGGQIWFVAQDVCSVLDIANPRDAIRRLEEDERGHTNVDTLGGPQQTGVINESGLYALILTSRKPRAKAFRRWVTNEILPSLRRSAAGEPEPPSAGEIYVRLQTPGSYLVTTTPDRPTFVHSFAEPVVSIENSDLLTFSHLIGAIASLWRRYRSIATLGVDRGLSRHLLEATIQQAEELAQHHLWYRGNRGQEIAAAQPEH